ncbi:MAG: hypothetical protein HOE11_01760 [Candidatus Diapherotrites archaeon]|jgi:hypothetical protein|nr:hypothetical protein [Candidatus Diapherotrites archaeon]MBT4597093.1 hypothetical protein [Candidatus Diapherotrites archaeon]
MRKGNSQSAMASSTRFFRGLGDGRGTSQRKIHKTIAQGSGAKVSYSTKRNAHKLVDKLEISAEEKTIAQHIIDFIGDHSEKSREDIVCALQKHPELVGLKIPYAQKNGMSNRRFSPGAVRATYNLLKKAEIITMERIQ